MTEKGEEEERGATKDDKTAWERFYSGAVAVTKAVEQATNVRIAPANPREVNPWLDRSGMYNYLVNQDRKRLLALVDKPERL